MNTFATVALLNSAGGAAQVNGMALLEPVLGFSTAYSVGEEVWAGRTYSRSILTFVTSSTDTFECFGPDAEGNLVSLGTLNAGWVLTFGDLGSASGAARIYPK